jgi:DNA ligase-1
VIKDLDGAYHVGKRSPVWTKFKTNYARVEAVDTGLDESFDVVVIGATYGRGKRSGRLASFLVATYKHRKGTFEALCDVAVGFNDEAFQEFTELFEPNLLHRPPRGVTPGEALTQRILEAERCVGDHGG